jgi:hypothetical protein
MLQLAGAEAVACSSLLMLPQQVALQWLLCRHASALHADSGLLIEQSLESLQHPLLLSRRPAIQQHEPMLQCHCGIL